MGNKSFSQTVVINNRLTDKSSDEEVERENLRILSLYNSKNWTTNNFKIPIFPGVDMALNPGVSRYVYKLARVKIGNEFSTNISVLLTLLINANKTKISSSHEYKEHNIVFFTS